MAIKCVEIIIGELYYSTHSGEDRNEREMVVVEPMFNKELWSQLKSLVASTVRSQHLWR